MAGLVPAIHVLQYLRMAFDICDTNNTEWRPGSDDIDRNNRE